MSLVCEGFVTFRALEWLFTTVQSKVGGQTALGLARFVTLGAWEWALILVHFTVLGQSTLGLESHVAV